MNMGKIEPVLEHVSDSEDLMDETVAFDAEDSASFCDNSYHSEDEFDGLSDSESQASEDDLHQRVKEAESQMKRLLNLTYQLEIRIAVAMRERKTMHQMRIKLLYRNLAAAVLGRLMASSRDEFAKYNDLCLAYLRRLLQLQEREAVTRTTKMILCHLQTRIRQQAPHLLGRNAVEGGIAKRKVGMKTMGCKARGL